MPDEDDDEECFACPYLPPPIAAAVTCTAVPSLDCTRTNFFPELRDRYLVNSCNVMYALIVLCSDYS